MIVAVASIESGTRKQMIDSLEIHRKRLHASPAPRLIVALVVLLLFVASNAQGQTLTITFIGNEGLQITDGEHTLYTDFPYQSGAYGYNEYGAQYLVPNDSAAALITHRHLDHFDESLAQQVGWKILETDADTLWDTAVVTPITTRHSDIAHRSWLVDWHGVRLYFVGDTDDSNALLDQSDLDVAFVTPWLLDIVKKKTKLVDAKTVVIYHHTANEAIKCTNCIIPKQGDRFNISEREPLTPISKKD